MPCQLVALCIDSHDPAALAEFWSGVLRRDVQPDGVSLGAGDGDAWGIRFVPTDQPKVVANQIHFDLTSDTPQMQDETVARALALGARHIDVGQKPEEGHVVLADPEGNEFCVIEAGNNFLAGCGFLGALSSDGSQAVGHFWSRALDWPLVWDQDEETAVQSPAGGAKITWGGPPLAPKVGKYRLHLDLAPTAGSDLETEVRRLEGLGARRVDIGQTDVPWVVLEDPDGHEFCVLPA